MKEIKLNTISELIEKLKELDPKRLRIILDNDNTSFYYGDEEKDDALEFKISETNGYDDIEPLYKLLFPNSVVNWC